ncbi:Glutamine--fructose-6-phosphate aminotransferase [isomerizing] [Pseudovibrio axinellae]|uniref:Glutamine--fructose-6-phosphate aminotransferase [isomerizing] n=1 Tax=Pseudovibrio axinellae TaxID=989403 RepID=A0A165T4X1_9HYPH|nr:SIS domain-containing protein [Pseudovibrio axinellae]KZL05436.1 Glutamine--fructose-6-phosphate aminotransferase [isomerizing] [Pseudovibrio axinellae]SEP99292.1 glutamine--fructose-6-phosphate transaminase [Pseudovibrio axinellae]
MTTKHPGALMRAEIDQAIPAFAAGLRQTLVEVAQAVDLSAVDAFYTIARGSSDAAANLISYEFMAQLNKPVTTLPPSVFSLGSGLQLGNVAALIVSQSGASKDLIRAAIGFRAGGGKTIAITNTANSPLADETDACININAGIEQAVPATKTVLCTVATSMALLAALKPEYAQECETAAKAMLASANAKSTQGDLLVEALKETQNVYVIGRGCGLGAAHEVALKLKETAVIHAEAYSAAEVLHGPLQLATKPLTVIILDTGEDVSLESLSVAQTCFKAVGANVFRLTPGDIGAQGLTPAASAAMLLRIMYPVILEIALQMGLDPDQPETLSKTTVTI